MKLPQLLTRKKLRATTVRRPIGLPDGMDYEEMSEPNMKLSRALLIVLVLHVVAVAGIIAFNTIKSRQGPLPTASATTTKATVPAKSEIAAGPSVDVSTARRDEVKPAHSPVKPAAKPAPASSAKPDAAKTTYVVAKGDNPVTIAKKFKITYDDLIAANRIEDPHKLKIGQKLVIPVKAPKSK
jgi:nucleoid-associated protein YgaU